MRGLNRMPITNNTHLKSVGYVLWIFGFTAAYWFC